MTRDPLPPRRAAPPPLLSTTVDANGSELDSLPPPLPNRGSTTTPRGRHTCCSASTPFYHNHRPEVPLDPPVAGKPLCPKSLNPDANRSELDSALPQLPNRGSTGTPRGRHTCCPASTLFYRNHRVEVPLDPPVTGKPLCPKSPNPNSSSYFFSRISSPESEKKKRAEKRKSKCRRDLKTPRLYIYFWLHISYT